MRCFLRRSTTRVAFGLEDEYAGNDVSAYLVHISEYLVNVGDVAGEREVLFEIRLVEEEEQEVEA